MSGENGHATPQRLTRPETPDMFEDRFRRMHAQIETLRDTATRPLLSDRAAWIIGGALVVLSVVSALAGGR